MSNNKIMTVQEWVAQDSSTREYDAVSRPFYSMQQYAEYYHFEKIHIYTGDQLQAAKEYSKICINAHHRNMVEAAWIAGNNAKLSDALEFVHYIKGCSYDPFTGMYWQSGWKTIEQLYSQFQSRDK